MGWTSLIYSLRGREEEEDEEEEGEMFSSGQGPKGWVSMNNGQ